MKQRLRNSSAICTTKRFATRRRQLTQDAILDRLNTIRDTLVTQHNGLFRHLVDDLIGKVAIFGVHFASLDIRQEASEHGRVIETLAEAIITGGYTELSQDEKLTSLLSIKGPIGAAGITDAFARDTIATVTGVREIQQQNGLEACSRYIISQCQNSVHVMEVYALFLLADWKTENLSIDIVPLFETITDLQNAPTVMQELYSLPVYREHLSRRKNRQTIMLGFSDGTKDGGYLMANWSIYRAKDELTPLARPWH